MAPIPHPFFRNGIDPISPPGSADAVAQGCTCSFVKNEFGRGLRGPEGSVFFYFDTDCPLHGPVTVKLDEAFGLQQRRWPQASA